MKFKIKAYLLLPLFLLGCIKSVYVQESSTDPFELYTQDKNNKILIIPFEAKMYASSIDHAIAETNNIPYRDVKESLSKSTAEQLLLSLSQKTPAVSLAHHQDSANKMLNYIYNSIGFKYDLIKTKDTANEELSKKEMIKDKLHKFVNQIHIEEHHEKKRV